jgi:formylglycine-generating enzyme required for sulfatase activity
MGIHTMPFAMLAARVLVVTPIVLGLSWAPAFAADSGPWPELFPAGQEVAVVGGGDKDAAVIASAERYHNLPAIPGAKENALAWYRYLKKALGVPFVQLLLDQKVVKEKLRDAATQAAAEAKPGGTLWYVFIGHGAPSKDGDGLLIGADADQDAKSMDERSLRRSDLKEILSRSNAQRMVVVLDSCFSGKLPDGKPIVPGLQMLGLTTPLSGLKEGLVILTAARGDQFAGPLPGARRPAFSYLVLGALRGWADADRNGEVTAAEVQRYAADTLRELLTDREQTPTLEGTSGAVLSKAWDPRRPDIAAIVTKIAARPAAAAPLAVPDAEAPDLAAAGADIEIRAAIEAVRKAMQSGTPEEKAASWKALAALSAYSGREEAARKAAAFEAYVERFRRLQVLAEKIGMVVVPAGQFRRGNARGDADEGPERSLTLKTYLIDRTEVAAEVYGRCVDAGRCGPTAGGGGVSGQLPVTGVSWQDAAAYCTFAGKRLPTEAEWEKAARGADGRTYPWGERLTCLRANYDACNKEGPIAVGSLPEGASLYGALDMVGNVWEWTADWYVGDYYASAPDRDPPGPQDGTQKVIRGGAFNAPPRSLSASYRSRSQPNARLKNLGFRCARDP